jgi:predicted RNase H-like nuclease
MPHKDEKDLRLYQDKFYEANKAKILKYKKEKYRTRDSLIVENLKLQEQIRELNSQLLVVTENKRYFKPKSEIIDMDIVSGNFSLSFE